jgi:hypothetical protein
MVNKEFEKNRIDSMIDSEYAICVNALKVNKLAKDFNKKWISFHLIGKQ